MELRKKRFRLANTCRLIASPFPTVGILDTVASPEDLEAIFELEAWTNDRISNELGIIQRIPREEWVVNRANATVIMAAFCHPNVDGARFSDSRRGAWYAARELETAHAEIIYHRSMHFGEIGVTDGVTQERLYLADFDAEFHVLPSSAPSFLDPDSYRESQKLGRALLEQGSNGIVYPSVRRPGGQCAGCFRPPLVMNVRQSAYFEYRWVGRSWNDPVIRQLAA
jgi:hypothetical protein